MTTTYNYNALGDRSWNGNVFERSGEHAVLDLRVRPARAAEDTGASGPECNWSESHESFRPMLWESCACRRLTTWLQVEKVRALSSAPLLRPMRVTSSAESVCKSAVEW